MEELPYVTEARKTLASFVPAFEKLATQVSSLHASDKQLSDRVADLTRLLSETRQELQDAEHHVVELADKADRGEQLAEATQKLVEALDRLPISIEEANEIPGSTKPAIALYGTYEWQNVVDAKFYVKEKLKERRTI